MTRKERVEELTSDGLSAAMAETVVALEDADDQLLRLQATLYRCEDAGAVRAYEVALRRLADDGPP